MDKQQREQQVKAFFEAAKTGDVAGLALALAAQVDVNEWDDDGCAAIHLAAAGGHEQAVQFLLGNGANLEARTNLGSTALNLAAASGSRRVVGVLIGAGARVDTPNNNYRNTPVHSAAVGGHLRCAGGLARRQG
jgi:ankyrin repeat protein